MITTGIVRNLDALGRIVLPKELRTSLEIDIGDPLEVFLEDDKLILKKYEPGCLFCGNARDVRQFKGRMICTDCRSKV